MLQALGMEVPKISLLSLFSIGVGLYEVVNNVFVLPNARECLRPVKFG
jgi:hypothetical protein